MYLHVIDKMYKILLKFKVEQVEDCMIKCTKNSGHNIHTVRKYVVK